MTSLKRIVSKSQILVEGRDPEVFFEEFCRHLHVDHKVQIQNFGGVKELKGFLKAFVNSPGFDAVEALGIIRDAEKNDANAARDSVRNFVNAAGLHLSWQGREPSKKPIVRTYIFPDDSSPGMLETMLNKSIADCSMKDCIDEFLKCVEERRGEELQNPAKARAHAYLATRAKPLVSVGVAAQKGYWNFGHDAFADIRRFIEDLAKGD